MSGKLILESKEISLAEVVDSAIETIRPSASAKQIRIVRQFESELCIILGDRVRLDQVVLNLLSNALKFTPRGGRVEVSLHKAPPDAVLRVRDNGQGISRDFLPVVFDRFRQADASEKRSHGGLGLGLTIARRLVELHSGTITADSDGDGRGQLSRPLFPSLPLPQTVHQRLWPQRKLRSRRKNRSTRSKCLRDARCSSSMTSAIRGN